MALLLRDLTLDIPVDEKLLPLEAARHLGVDAESLKGLRIVRRSVDARKKSRIRKVYTVEFSCSDETALLQSTARVGSKGSRHSRSALEIPGVYLPRLNVDHHALVIGMGPAGLFAARRLAESGVRVTLVDRGRKLEQRVADVENFWLPASLTPSAMCSSVKVVPGPFPTALTTRLNHPQRLTVLKTLVACGAPENILVEARPHVGTDRCAKVVINFREDLVKLGVDIRFETCLTEIETHRGSVTGGVFNGKELLSL